MLPFTHAQFLQVFAQYNQAVWPAQVVAYLLAACMLAALAFGRAAWRGRVVAGGLAVMWLWTGVAYHWIQFAAINKAAWAFGGLFVLQGVLFAHAAFVGKLQFAAGGRGWPRWIGGFLIAYASVVYPLIGIAIGPGYPETPMFGITPCPVTLFTFGLLLWSTSRVSRWLLVIPLAWSLIGGSAALLLQVPQDWLLLASGASVLLLWKRP
jgi:hypothetical protein